MREWKEYKLGDVAEITSSKRIFFSDYVEEGVTFYRSKEIIEKAQGLEISTDLFISKDKYGFIKDTFGSPVNGDILIAAVGERAGIPYLVNNDGDFYFKDGNLIWFRNISKEVSSKFLVYYFKSYNGQQTLESSMIGSAQKALTIIGLKGLEVKFPPFKEQTAIASVLSSLDDKIDLLHRQNKTLEHIAETLFRQWFVEKRGISWELGKLDEIAIFNNGKSRPDELENGSIPIYGGNGILGYTSLSNYDGISIIIGRVGAYCGCIYLENQPIWLSDNALHAKSKQQNNIFLYYLLKGLELNSMAEGSSHPLLTQTLLKSIDITIPPAEIINTFEKHAIEFWDKIYNNTKQIKTLTQLRDTLLPKLMSGEVSVIS